MSIPFSNKDWIIREIRKQVTKNTIKKLKKGKIDLSQIAVLALSETLYSNLKSKKPKRKNFTKSVKKAARERQRNRCNICKQKPPTWEYDHINGDSSYNRFENCQALCPNCHSKKTRHVEEKKQKIFQSIKWLKFLLKELK